MSVKQQLITIAKIYNDPNFRVLNLYMPKYYISYDISKSELKVCCTYDEILNTVYFSSLNVANYAIDKIGSDKIINWLLSN